MRHYSRQQDHFVRKAGVVIHRRQPAGRNWGRGGDLQRELGDCGTPGYLQACRKRLRSFREAFYGRGGAEALPRGRSLRVGESERAF